MPASDSQDFDAFSTGVLGKINYLPLQKPHNIRLLTLHAGNFESPIHVSISHHCIDDLDKGDTIKFEALSYVWGSPEKVFPIYYTAESQAISITQNLFQALRHLRYSKSSRVLWVDALCIN